MKKDQGEEAVFLIAMGKRIQWLRKERGMTQVVLATLCDFEKSNLSRIEAGKTNTTVLSLQKIARVLEIPLSQLFSRGD
jgi:putative transcriptional regulator